MTSNPLASIYRNSLKLLAAYFLLVPAFALSQAIQEGDILTLEQAKKIAVDRNAGLKAAKAQTDEAKAREGRAQSGFYPALESRFGSEQGLSAKSSKSSTFGYLMARWNLYRGGKDLANTKAASVETMLSEHEFNQQQLTIENDVESVFVNLLFLRDVASIKERFIELNSKQQDLAKQVVARGGASESDVVEFDLRSATLRSELVKIEQDYKGTLIRLKSLLGEDIAKNPKPAGELPHQHFQGNLNDYINPNLEEAPPVKSAALALDIANHKLNATKSRWLPQLDLEGRFGNLPASEYGDNAKLAGTVAVVATWDLFSGFDTLYETKEKIAGKSRADWQLKSDINTLLAEIESNFGELATIQRRSDLEKDSILNSKKYYDLIFADFKRGYKNAGDFSLAAQTWYNAEVQRKQLDLDFVEKKLALELKLGRKISTVPMKDAVVPATEEKK